MITIGLTGGIGSGKSTVSLMLKTAGFEIIDADIIARDVLKKYPEILEKVKGIIVEQLGVTDTAVTMEASFIDDLGADSLDIVELIMAIEEEFDIEIPDSDAEKVVTVGDVVDYIKENVQ